jgi:replication-associated recombination protein RarA
MRLSEKYRPKTFQEVIGQDKAIALLKRLSEQGVGGHAYWIAGESGTGKTTLAEILAANFASQEFDITRSVARDLSITDIREITQRWMYCGNHAWIVNEAHGLNRPCIELLLDILEGLSDKVLVVFTTTNAGNDLFEDHIDAAPFSSRCVNVKLTNQGLCQCFAQRAYDIANAENLNGKPIAAYQVLAKQYKNNLRAMLSAIETGAMQN